MLMGTRSVVRSACVAAILLTTATAAMGANSLANPGFEAVPAAPSGTYGAALWGAFGGVYTQAADACQVPHAGNQLCKMFGNFTGGFNVSGIFQAFPTTPGSMWQLSCYSRHCSSDPMIHSFATNGNWVVQKIAFFDATNTEIAPAAVESTILDGSYPTNTWFFNSPITGVAPAGAVSVQALILYLQPAGVYDGGAAQIDDVSLENVTATPTRGSSWGQLKSLYR
jgi:hypothetical protein